MILSYIEMCSTVCSVQYTNTHMAIDVVYTLCIQIYFLKTLMLFAGFAYQTIMKQSSQETAWAIRHSQDTALWASLILRPVDCIPSHKSNLCRLSQTLSLCAKAGFCVQGKT